MRLRRSGSFDVIHNFNALGSFLVGTEVYLNHVALALSYLRNPKNIVEASSSGAMSIALCALN